MKISILIPTFNRAKYLPRAIKSALSQDYKNIEVIVSDNASTDETSMVVENFINDLRFKYFKNKENLGMVPNWRKSLTDYATGDFFIVLSDDDYIIDNNYISKAVELIKTNPEIVIVYANGYIYHEDTKKMEKLILPFRSVELGKIVFLSRNKVFPQDFCLCNILFKRNLALKLNAFSNDFNISCDSELFLKMCLYGNVGVIKNFVSVYQIHSDNLLFKQKSDLKLTINNIDDVLEPYKLAKKSGKFTAIELEKWENEVIVFDMLYLLFTVLVFQDKNYKKVLKILKDKDPVAVKKVQKSFRFKIILLLYQIRLLSLLINLLRKFGIKNFF